MRPKRPFFRPRGRAEFGAAALVTNGGFRPDQLGAVALWLDASAPWTLFQDAAATLPVTADGEPVGAWQSRAGSHGAVQAGANARPSLHFGAGESINGRTVVRFDGSDDYLATSRLTGAFVAGYTSFVVAALPDGQPPAQWNYLLGGHYDVASVQKDYLVMCLYGTGHASVGQLRHIVTGASVQANKTYTTLADGSASARIYTAVVDPPEAGNFLAVYSNGAQQTPAAPLSGLGSWSAIAHEYTETLGLGCRLMNLTPSYYLAYDLAELILYARPLADAERQKVEAYLAAKYAIALG
ncbi:MAG: hypothetical protein ACYC35_23930 [Pirellulales bacterium]